MIPERAFFYWESVNGAWMPWIRQEGLASFKRHNPTWEVVMLEGDKETIPGGAYLDVVHRSDLARYVALRDVGGVYFDTDIIFLKPIPDEWRDCSLLLPRTVDNTFTQVAALGATAGSKFFSAVAHECETRITNGRNLSYQALGVEAMSKCVNYVMGGDTRWIKTDSILPVSWRKADVIWNPSPMDALHPSTVGFHWFGGDPLSRHMEAVVNEEWARSSNALLACSIRDSRARASL